jgi:DNA-binding CsgD family transcriptional regulator
LVTARQQQCLALIASGLTNKEIAHQLSITERGVAALVSRLLVRFDVSNRAGLVARVMSDRLAHQAAEEPPLPDNEWSLFLPTLQRDLDAYRTSPFLIAVTIGLEQRLVFLSDMMKRLLLADGAEGLLGTDGQDRDQSANARWWRARSDEVFRSGVARSLDSVPQPWPQRDTVQNASFSCVVQPLRDARTEVRGVIWICGFAER